jgi:hypothetical protein
MKKPLFNASHLKIKRAYKHIRELHGVLNSFGKTSGYGTRAETDSETGEGIVSFEMTEEVSDDISMIVGDVVHNLRAALDLAVYELVKRFGGKRPDRVYFPFRKTWQKVVKAIKEGAIEGLPVAFEIIIVDVIKPYEGGNTPLYTLHTLDIADKHHDLVPTRAFAGLTVKAVGEDGPVYYVTFSTELSGEESIIRIPKDEKIEGYHQPMLHVSFDGVKGLEEKSILPTLLQLKQLTTEVINALEGTFLTLSK